MLNQVGTVAAQGAMASRFFGSCLSGRHAGKQVMLKVQPRGRKTIFQVLRCHLYYMYMHVCMCVRA